MVVDSPNVFGRIPWPTERGPILGRDQHSKVDVWHHEVPLCRQRVINLKILPANPIFRFIRGEQGVNTVDQFSSVPITTIVNSDEFIFLASYQPISV
jgi:hypothetical protein